MARPPRAIRVLAFALVMTTAVTASVPALAQTPSGPEPPTDATPVESPQSPFDSLESRVAQGGAADTPRPTRRFLIDVAHDYRNVVSWESAQWLAMGGVVSLAVSGADEALRAATEDPDAPVTMALDNAGATYGNLTLQAPIAVGWWVVSRVAGSERGTAAGRDLLRAQISALSWTYAIKYAVNRERPNGDPRSFPSGHASATFATAMVLQQHYGWKVGLPIFAAATYTAGSRITVNKHWASDVAFGAVLGMVSARAVTVHLRKTPLSVSPLVVPGGAGVLVTALR